MHLDNNTLWGVTYKRLVFHLITKNCYLSKTTLTETSIFSKEIPVYCYEVSDSGDTNIIKTYRAGSKGKAYHWVSQNSPNLLIN
jgi:hypothetical protein